MSCGTDSQASTHRHRGCRGSQQTSAVTSTHAAPSAAAVLSIGSQATPLPAPPPRSIVPQPRSIALDIQAREAAIAAVPQRLASPHTIEEVRVQSSIRCGQPNRQQQHGGAAAASGAVLAAGSGNAARSSINGNHRHQNGTPSTANSDSKGFGGMHERFSKQTNFNYTNADGVGNNFFNNEGSGGSGGRRQRTSMESGGGGVVPGNDSTISNNNKAGNNTTYMVSAANANLCCPSAVNTINEGNNSNGSGGGGTGTCSSCRHLQPPSNHSRVNLFVRDLPLDMKEDQLRALFSPYGEIVNSAIMRNIHTGVSLGTAFVRFAQHHEALRAMEAFVGGRAMAGSRRVTVQWAKKEHDKAPAGDERKRMRKLFIRNVPKDVTQEMLTQLFNQFGPVKTVSTHRDTAAANAVSQSSGGVVPGAESLEHALDLSVSAGSLSLTATTNTTTNISAANNNNDDRRIAFVTFDVEGVAERATTAIHNTMPFASCNGIPLMVKLAEDTPVRHTNNSGNNNNGNPNFSAVGTLGSAGSAASVPAGNVTGGMGHSYSVSGQPSNTTMNWGDFNTNEFLHSPPTSPPTMHLSANAGPVPLTGPSHNGPAATWRAHTPNNNNNSNAVAVPSLSAPRSFGGAATGNAPSPSTLSFTGVTPMNSNTVATPGAGIAVPPVAARNIGPGALRQAPPQQSQQQQQHPQSQGTSAKRIPLQNTLAAQGLSNPLSREKMDTFPDYQQQSTSSHSSSGNNSYNKIAAANTTVDVPVAAQSSPQDLIYLKNMVSGSDMYNFQPLTSASMETLGLVTGSTSATPNYDAQDYYVLSNSYSSRGVAGANAGMPLPLQQQRVQLGPHNAPTSVSPNPALPCSSTSSFSASPLSFFQNSLQGAHSYSPQSTVVPSTGHPTNTTTTATVTPFSPQPHNSVIASSSTSALGQPAGSHRTRNSSSSHVHHNNGKASSPSSTVLLPAPRSVAAAAAAAAAAANRTTAHGDRTSKSTDAVTEKGELKTQFAVHSDLVANHHSRAGRHASTIQSGAAAPNASSLGITCNNANTSNNCTFLTTSNPELASSFSSTDNHCYQPYDSTGILGTGARSSRPLNLSVNSCNSNQESSKARNMGIAVTSAVGQGNLRIAPPTLPTGLSLPPSGTSVSPGQQFFAQCTPAPSASAAAAASPSSPGRAILPLDTTLGPFEYDDCNDVGTVDTPSKAFAAEVLRAVTEGTESDDGLGSAGLKAAPANIYNTAALSPSSENSCSRRRSLTSPSSMFPQKDSSDNEGRTSDVSSTTRTTGGKPMSLSMGAPALLGEQLLYQWDCTAASTTGATNSPLTAGAVGSQAPSPVSGLGHAKSYNILTLMPPQSTSMTQDLTGTTATMTDGTMSMSNMWLTADVGSYWGALQMKDPLTLLPQPETTGATCSTVAPSTTVPTTTFGEVASGNSTQTASFSVAGLKSPGDLSRRSTARTLPGTTVPLMFGNEDEDDEQTGWGVYPDLALNVPWDVVHTEETQRKSREGTMSTAGACAATAAGIFDPLLYGQQMNEDTERLYSLMTYDDGSY